jgi:hypothetical protein
LDYICRNIQQTDMATCKIHIKPLRDNNHMKSIG